MFRAITTLLLVGGLAAIAFAQSPQSAARKERKMIKEYQKEVKKAVKEEVKDIRFPDKPGVGKPPGRGWRQDDFDINALKADQLGLAFVNRGEGIVVEQLYPRSAMAEYGFRDGDRIVAVDGHEIGREKEFFQYVFGEDVRTGKVGITIVRDGREREIIVAPLKLIEKTTYDDPLHVLGVTLGDRADNELRIVEVLPQSPADRAELRRGDEIYMFDGVEVKTARELRDVLRASDAGAYYIRVARNEGYKKLAVDLPKPLR